MSRTKWFIFCAILCFMPATEGVILWAAGRARNVPAMLDMSIKCMTGLNSFPSNIDPNSAVAYEINDIRLTMDSLFQCNLINYLLCGPQKYAKLAIQFGGLIAHNPGIFGTLAASPIVCIWRSLCLLSSILASLFSQCRNVNDITINSIPPQFLPPPSPANCGVGILALPGCPVGPQPIPPPGFLTGGHPPPFGGPALPNIAVSMPNSPPPPVFMGPPSPYGQQQDMNLNLEFTFRDGNDTTVQNRRIERNN